MRTKDFDKLERIKRAIVNVTLKEGIDGCSVAKIARAAGVSPATIYVYYENKEEMLSAVFSEYAHQSYFHMTDKLIPDMSAEDLIETIVRSAYNYALDHEEAFSFVEQCSSNPALQECVTQTDCCPELLRTIHAYQERGLIRSCSDQNMVAVLFAPIKFFAFNHRNYPDRQEGLDELIELLQNALIY
ncbi:MAG: TetR/AcrR family transcriptional regulator [Erysipelotrichaceae bacterium]|jgi:AcrR family transcriptional regulator|nr:TetR/AcrR family transcriptional regulator [Erysipelotrichaceae bacterium]MCR5096736.1 TetR/AcrR family transcriptional regulator [Erysipelotrichaceae bacterium]